MKQRAGFTRSDCALSGRLHSWCLNEAHWDFLILVFFFFFFVFSRRIQAPRNFDVHQRIPSFDLSCTTKPLRLKIFDSLERVCICITFGLLGAGSSSSFGFRFFFLCRYPGVTAQGTASLSDMVVAVSPFICPTLLLAYYLLSGYAGYSTALPPAAFMYVYLSYSLTTFDLLRMTNLD